MSGTMNKNNNILTRSNKRSKRRSKQSSNPSRFLEFKIFSFTRAVSINIPISSGSTAGTFGWNNVGTNSLQLYGSLQTFRYDTGGSGNTANMPSYTEFTALFDEWRLRRMDFDFYFSKNDHASNTNSQLPVLFSCHDYNDSLPLANADEVLQYNPYVVKQLGNARGEDPRVHFSVVPKTTITNNAGGTALIGDMWVNSIYPDTLWRGVKIWYDNNVVGAAVLVGQITIVATMHYEFRHPR